MRRLLVPLLLLPLALTAAPATADPCGTEGDECHPVDCLPWDPVGSAPGAVERVLAGDPAGGVASLLPPTCPA